VLGGGGLAAWGRFAGGEICWWREPTAGLNTRFIGVGAASGGGATPASSPGCSSSAIRHAIRRASSPGSKSADLQLASKAAGHVGGGHKPNAVFARKQAIVRSPARPPRFPGTAPRCLGPLLAPHSHRATPRTQPRGQNPDTTSGPTPENTVLRGKARSAPGSSLQQGLMAVRASPSDPLNTLASVGGAAQGARATAGALRRGR
jgi:hypothetical protein